MGKEEDLIHRLNDVYGLLCEYTSGEEDEELIQYHDELLDIFYDVTQYIEDTKMFKRQLNRLLEGYL